MQRSIHPPNHITPSTNGFITSSGGQFLSSKLQTSPIIFLCTIVGWMDCGSSWLLIALGGAMCHRDLKCTRHSVTRWTVGRCEMDHKPQTTPQPTWTMATMVWNVKWISGSRNQQRFGCLLLRHRTRNCWNLEDSLQA
jgi:hypothetical protein